MSTPKSLSNCLLATSWLLLVVILVFVYDVGPRMGWSKFAKTEAGKSYSVILPEAPVAVHIASIGVMLAFPICIIEHVLARRRDKDR
jgi:hypothetical protein